MYYYKDTGHSVTCSSSKRSAMCRYKLLCRHVPFEPFYCYCNGYGNNSLGRTAALRTLFSFRLRKSSVFQECNNAFWYKLRALLKLIIETFEFSWKHLKQKEKKTRFQFVVIIADIMFYWSNVADMLLHVYVKCISVSWDRFRTGCKFLEL